MQGETLRIPVPVDLGKDRFALVSGYVLLGASSVFMYGVTFSIGLLMGRFLLFAVGEKQNS